MSRLFVTKPLVMALGVVFSGSVYAVPSMWDEDAAAMCQAPSAETHSVEPAKTSGGAKLPEDATRITSDKALGQIEERHRSEGNVIIERNDETLNAEWVDYDQKTETVDAGDKFKLTRADGQTVEGEKLHYDLKNSQGVAENSEFEANQDGRRLQGISEHVEMQDKQKSRMKNVKFNTCNPGDKSWYIQASELTNNQETGIGVAKNARLVFGGVPILYTPWADFPTRGNRKSGFLVPTVSVGSDGGTISLPYYFNLEPNYDATIAPGVITERGLRLDGEFRYLQPEYSGSVNVAYMPHDKKHESNNRYLINARHNQRFNDKLSGGIDFNQASDDDYYQDFSTRNGIAESVNLNRSAWLNYNDVVLGEPFSAQLLVQKYQALKDANGAKDEPYARLPQLSAKWKKHFSKNGTFKTDGQLTYFEHSDKQAGTRTIVYPNIQWDFHNQWGYVRPKVGLHATRYWLNDFGSLKSRNTSRVLPIVNVDSGITLERETQLFGKDLVQTLEPRLFYNYIPSKAQNDLPLFDTSENDFTYPQLFRENIYSGGDRINSSNSMSVGVQTTFLDGKTFEEYFRAGIGQKYYFTDDNVLLEGSIDKTARKRSDIVAFAAGRVHKNWWLESNWHWDESEKKNDTYSIGVRYNPQPGKVISARYKYGRDEEIYSGFYGKMSHIDLGTQWPITNNLYMVGRLDYSLPRPRLTLEQTLGLEYKNPCGCWSASFVAQRYVSGLNKHKTGFFFTLQLKDLSTIGKPPYETLRLGIPGYTKTNEVNFR
ncbi:LPS-assembly protein LptD [Kingella negevensis]|uniref:LPS-assembly protein LptD n=1 Tax=Kingella negevensis TaxID=1522312 RepID=UPI003D6FA8C7